MKRFRNFSLQHVGVSSGTKSWRVDQTVHFCNVVSLPAG